MSTSTKILIAEHDMHDIELLQYELKRSGLQYVSKVVDNETEFINAIKTFIPDLILSDYTFPAFDATAAFKIKEALAPDIPFIVISGTIGEEKSVELIKNGVTDYVLKDRLFTLSVKVKRALKESGKKREKANADRAFQKTLNDYQKIMDSSLDVICTIDGEGKFVTISSASEKIFGFKPEELKGTKYIDLVFIDDVDNTNVAAAEIMNCKPVTFFENRYTRKDGSLVPIIWSASWDNDDKLMYCIAKDASGKKQLERAVETERERFYELFLQAPSCMGILKGPDYRFEMANPLYLKLVGKEDIVGKALKDVLPEIVEQGFIKILDSVYNTGETFSANEMLVKLDKNGTGELIDAYLNFIYQAYKNDEGAIQGIFFFAIDVTEQVVLRKKIEESESRFRTMIEKGSDMITLSDKEGKLLYGTPSITKILGYSFEEFKNKSSLEFMHPDDLPFYVKKRNEILETPGASFTNEERVLHKNGNWVWCESCVTNMLHEPGINAFVANFKDISERKMAEQRHEFDKSNLDALINNTKDLMWSVDRDFNLITSNQPFDNAIAHISGLALFKGDNILNKRFSPNEINRFKKAYERAFAGESFTEIEYRDIPAEAWSEISFCPMHHGNEIIGVACHSRDITQFKINERTVRDERILLRTLIDNLPSNVYTKDINSRKTLSNRKDYEFIGVESEEEVLGKDDFWFFSDKTSKATRIEEQEIFYTGVPIINKEEHQQKRDGSTTWFLKSKIPLRNQHNEIIGLIGVSHDITEIKKTEEQLKKSEAFNRGVLNSLSSHIAVIESSGRIVAVNEAWEQFGMQNIVTILPRSKVGSNYYEVCENLIKAGNEIVVEVLQSMKNVMDEKIPTFYFEYACHSPGEQRWFGLRVMKFESDEPMIVAAHQDITERKLAEEAMSLTQFAVDNAGDAIFWMEPNAHIVNINEAACSLLGYTKEEMLTLSVPDIDPYYNADRWVIQFEELRQKKSLFFETVQRAKDGRSIPVEIRTTYIKFADKEYNCAFVRDITGRKKAQEHLLKSEAGLREAQAIARIGNWEINLETKTHTWSDEYCNILKITKEEAHPSLEYYLSFMHPDDLDHVKQIIAKNQHVPDPISYEFRFIRKDGVVRYGFAQSRFELDKNNKPIRLYGVMQDITERKLAEFKLEQQNAELTKTNFELDRFVYSASHELRSPLTSILGLASFIEEESKEADTLEYAKMIKNSVNRLDGFIKNILSYSRNNRTESQVQEIPLTQSINEIVRSLYHMKEAEGINFEVNIKEDQPFYSDLQSFNAIMENLITNAIKFQKEEISGRYIKISGKSGKHNLNIRIEDNGIGIAPEYHNDIFKMFFRLSGKTGGTGIGLYIVKQMIDKLHGTMQVNSQTGEGTSFTIKLKNLNPEYN